MKTRRTWPMLLALVAVLLAILWMKTSLRGAIPKVPGAGEASAAKTQSPASFPAGARPIEIGSPPEARPSRAAPGVIEGQVLWSTREEGVPGAELTFERGGAAASTQTDGAGHFRFQPPVAGRWRLATASAKDFLPFAPEWGTSPIVVDAAPGVDVRGLRIRLVPALTYHGLVVDPAGKPVASAEVRILGAAQGEQALLPLPDRHTSGPDGAFDFHAPDGAMLEGRKDGFLPGRATLDFGAQVTHRLTIKLARLDGPPPKPLSIAGRVIDPGDHPVPNALVTALFDDPTPAKAPAIHPGAQALSDAAGQFRLDGLDAGHYDVAAIQGELAPGHAKAEAGATGVTLRLMPGGALRGTVQEAGAGPIAIFTVDVWRREGLHTNRVKGETFTSADGHFEMLGLPAGSLTATATAEGYAPSAPLAIDVSPGAPSRADFALSKGKTLRGLVRDRASKKPIEGAAVSIEGIRGDHGATAVRSSARTGGDGHFALGGLGPGTVAVFVGAADHHARIVSGLSIPDSADPSPIEVELTPLKPGEEPAVELAGIGAVLSAKGEVLVIGRTLPGGGAAEAGLLPDDQIGAVDGKKVTELGFEGAMGAIRGPEGTTVVLTFRRGDAGSWTDIVVTRRLVRG